MFIMFTKKSIKLFYNTKRKHTNNGNRCFLRTFRRPT